MGKDVASEEFLQNVSPIFILGFHRGGTTFVQRLLNCHRRVTIWGEHAGIVKELRAVYENYKNSPARAADFLRYRDFSEFASRFIPWVNPFSHEVLKMRLANFLESLYKPFDEYNGVWGFKEIRYGNSEDIKFLMELFPGCRILFLVRHPRALLLSQYFAKWGGKYFTQSAYVEVQEMVSGYIRALDAFLETAEIYPSNTMILQYEMLSQGCGVDDIFQHMQLNENDIDRHLLSCVLQARTGSSFGSSSRSVDKDYERELFEMFDIRIGQMLAESASERVLRVVKMWYPEIM